MNLNSNISDINPIFPAKVFLMGEYGILFGSMALSIPFTQYSGGLAFEKNAESPEIKMMEEYYIYLRESDNLSDFIGTLDFEKMAHDMKKGLVFRSDIPVGSGLGSSGALVASLYHRYAKQKAGKVDLKDLRRRLAVMENFFHGKSSGNDPLVCLLGESVLIDKDGSIRTVSIPGKGKGEAAVFLIDTFQHGSTRQMMEIVLSKMEHLAFRELFHSEFIAYNNSSIYRFLSGEKDAFFENLKSLSQFTLTHLPELIPGKFHQVWKQGLSSGNYFLKLCGSGGGGHILGFAKNYDNLSLPGDMQSKLVLRF